MTWEIFKNWDAPRKDGGMTCSIWKSAKIGLTPTLYNGIGANFVELFYDKETSRIGIKASTQHCEWAKKVSVNSGSKSINILGFMKHFGIPEKIKGKRYKVTFDDDMYVIHLKKSIGPVSKRR